MNWKDDTAECLMHVTQCNLDELAPEAVHVIPIITIFCDKTQIISHVTYILPSKTKRDLDLFTKNTHQFICGSLRDTVGKGDWDFRISDLVKTPMELTYNPCGEFR